LRHIAMQLAAVISSERGSAATYRFPSPAARGAAQTFYASRAISKA
jgi:hypothetical protein